MRKGAISIFAISLFVLSLSTGTPALAGFTRPIVFPVNGPHHFQDDFADPRSGGTREHLGIDIIAAKMTPVVAAVDGQVSYLVSPQASWGYAIFIRDADGYQYRYLHLNNDTLGTDDGSGGEANAYAPGIERGVAVKRGQHIGWVGDSGNAESTGSHLHFEMYDPQGSVFDPYESLLAALPPESIIGLPQGAPTKTVIVIPVEFELVRYKNDPTVFLLSQNTKYQIVNEATFAALGFSWSQIKIIPDAQQYRAGLPIQIGPSVVIQRQDGSSFGTGTLPRYLFTQTVSLGSRGEEVKQLQLKLKALGYFTYPSATAYFGLVTRDAVLRFQRAKNIEPVGIVGPKTRALLNTQ